MITEDDKYIYISDKKILNNFKLLDCSELGSSSNIYTYNNGKVLKIFDKNKTISELNKLEFIKNLNLKNFIKPLKFVFLNEQYYGYSMEYIKGTILIEFNGCIDFSKFIESLISINEDIMEFSENNIEIIDLNQLNLIYNYNKNILNIVDLDEYTVRKSVSKEELYIINRDYFKTIFFVSLTDYFNNDINKIYLNMLESYIKEDNLDKLSLYKIFYNLKFYLENITNTEINTLNDFRKKLIKVK